MKLARIAGLVLLAVAMSPVRAAETSEQRQEQGQKPAERRRYTDPQMEEDEDSPQAMRRARRERLERQRQQEAEEAEEAKQADANDVSDVNADPNASDKAQSETPLSDVLPTDKREVLLWSRNADQRTWVLAEAVYKQVEEELKAVKKLAAEEGAAKTVEAIDLILANRAERLEDINQRIKQKIERSRIKEPGAANRKGYYDREDRRTRSSRGRDYAE